MNVFNIIKYVENEEGLRYDDYVNVVDYSINSITIISTNSCFDLEKLAEAVRNAFHYGDFEFEISDSKLMIMF